MRSLFGCNYRFFTAFDLDRNEMDGQCGMIYFLSFDREPIEWQENLQVADKVDREIAARSAREYFAAN